MQPHSGAQANIAVYHALLQPGDSILGMKLDHGGHLSHGMKLNFPAASTTSWPTASARRTRASTMDELAAAGRGVQPKLIVAGWSAYPRLLDFARFRDIADSIGALLMVDMAHFAGLVAAGEHPNPVP